MTRSHTRVVSISRPNRDSLVAALAAAPEADLLEVRLDAIWPSPPDVDTATDDLVAITAATQQRLLATLRPHRQGGAYDGPEDVRVSLLVAATRAGFAAVDLENDRPEISELMAPFRSGGIILSDHRLPETPSKEVGMRIMQSMQDAAATYDKLAFPVAYFADNLRALELVHSHAHRAGHPAVAPIGGDAMLRALLPLAGNHATYGHDGSGPVIPGQPAFAEMEAWWRHWGITAADLPGDPEAGWMAVVGSPVEHSLSPRIHNAMLRADGQPQRYGALEVPDAIGAMRLLVTVAPRIGLRGASVTMPLKHHALAVTTPDEIAKQVGAANCIRFDAHGPHSTNTDATALARLLANHQSVAILGAGGAARAAAWAAHSLGLATVIVCRNKDTGIGLAREFGATWVPWESRAAVKADAYVQATPICDELVIEPSGDLFIELVYKDGATPSERAAKAAGMTVVSGQDFLIEQALDAYTFWTNNPANAATMRAVLA